MLPKVPAGQGVLTVAPARQYPPSGHAAAGGLACTEPFRHRNPAWQSEQAMAPAALNVPALHVTGAAADGPAQYEPAGHCVQLIDPAAAYVPGGQTTGCSDVDAQYEPAGHCVHCEEAGESEVE